MTRLFSLLLLLSLLVSCAPAPSAPVSPVPAAPTVTLTPTATPIPTPDVSQAFKEALAGNNLTVFYQMKNLDRQFAEHFSADESGRIFLTLADGQQVEVDPQSLETIDLAGENLAYKRLISLQTADGQRLVFFPGYQWSKEVNGETKKAEVPGQWFEAMVFPELEKMAEAGEPLTDKVLAQLIVEGIKSGQISPKDLANGRLMASALSSGVNYEGTLFNGWEKYLSVEMDGFGAESLFLRLGDGQKVEVDAASLAINVDINGNPLQVENAGFKEPALFFGTGEAEGKVFSFVPESRLVLDDQGNEKVYPAHWFEVIQNNHPIDPKASFEKQMEQREEAINDPVEVTVEQVQSGEWAMSVLLSGAVQPFPKGWKFTGNALNHNEHGNVMNGTLLYTSDKIPVDFLGVTEVNGKKIGLRPFLVWNPEDVKNPDRSQVLIVTVGIGEENLNEEHTLSYLDLLYRNPHSIEPILIVSGTDEFVSGPTGPNTYQPSILALKDLPGNDPAIMNMPYYFDGNRFWYYNDIVQYNSENEIPVWQYNFNISLPEALQRLIWLVYFS